MDTSEAPCTYDLSYWDRHDMAHWKAHHAHELWVVGTVLHVLYQERGWAVLKVRVDAHNGADKVLQGPAGNQQIVVSGSFLGLLQVVVGVRLVFFGSIRSTSKRPEGEFRISRWDVPVDRTPAQTYTLLYNCVDGFMDSAWARRIAWTSGALGYMDMGADGMDPSFHCFLTEEEQLLSPEEQLPLRRQWVQTQAAWRKARAYTWAQTHLQHLQLSPKTLLEVVELLGPEGLRELQSNPYKILALPSLTFRQAERLASSIDPKDRARMRVAGAILYVLQRAMQQGDVCLPITGFDRRVRLLAKNELLEDFDLSALPREMEQMSRTNILRAELTTGAIYLPANWMFERYSAWRIARLSKQPVTTSVDPVKFVQEYETRQGIALSDAQKQAVYWMGKAPVLVLTGLPGTGKTTVVKCITKLLMAQGHQVALLAPTGIAAKRMAGVTGREASTIHRFLKYDGTQWGYHRHNPYTKASAFVIDEMSLVDQELLCRLLEALPERATVVFVGDDAQLPSVGPGNVLRELMTHSTLPAVRLDQIFRQEDTSTIVEVSHAVHRGRVPYDLMTPTSDVKFVPQENEAVMVGQVVQLAAKLKERNANFQVMAPKYEGACGVNVLNQALREQLNPDTGQPSWSDVSEIGRLNVRVGDRVMVVKNEYKLGLYNGDMAKITQIQPRSLVLRVHGFTADATETVVEVPKESALTMLKLAYAITVHKAQGSEFDTIILPMSTAFGGLLQRNLFYTALTRAKKTVLLLGQQDAINRAVANNDVIHRHTLLGRSIAREIQDPRELFTL